MSRARLSRIGAVAQLVERVVRNDEVRGSTPLGSTRHRPGNDRGDPPNRRHAVPHRNGYKLDRPPPGWENPVIGAASPISGERRDEP